MSKIRYHHLLPSKLAPSPVYINFLGKMNEFLEELRRPVISFTAPPEENFNSFNELRLFFKAGLIDERNNMGVIIQLPKSSNLLQRINWNDYSVEVWLNNQKITEAKLFKQTDNYNPVYQTIIGKFPNNTLDPNEKNYRLVLINNGGDSYNKLNLKPNLHKPRKPQNSPSLVS